MTITQYPDIELEALILYPPILTATPEYNKKMYLRRNAHISAATAEREKVTIPFAEWCSRNGWKYSEGYEKWFDNKVKGGRTTAQLLQIFLNEK